MVVSSYTCSWFVHLLVAKKNQNNASTIDSRGTALVTQAQYWKSSPKSTGMARNRRLMISTSKPRSEIALVLQYFVSHKRAA